jgi:hypothetical protein
MCAQTPLQLWTETVSNLGQDIKTEFKEYDWHGAPNMALLAENTAKVWCYNMIIQGTFGAEYIGAHGVAANLCPPLEYHDDNHKWLLSQDEFQELCENWRERLDEEYHGPLTAP